MKTKTLPLKIIFFSVKNNQDKLNWICLRVQEAIKNEKRMLITVPHDEAAHYIDHLLWSMPEESFIPHSIIKAVTNDWIAITTSQTENLNRAHQLLNLCSQTPLLYQQFEEIYELYDETSANRLEAVQKKIQDYQSKKLSITINRS
jgi:DNA polymerase-3 subunit chi